MAITAINKLMDLGRDFAKRFNTGIYRFWCYPIGAVTVFNPEDAEILTSSMKHSEKSDIYNLLKSWLRDGLLLSKGVKWQTRRKILTPTFHFNILKQFSVILQENTLHLLQTLDMAEERPIDVVPVISEFTLNSICETAMGTQLSEQEIGASRIYKDAIYKIGSVISFRFCRVYLRSDLIFNLTSLGKVQKQIVEIIHSFTRKVIEQRKIMLQNAATTKEVDAPEFDDIYMKKKKKVAMLDLLISAEKDGLIDSVGIQEEVDTFMFEILTSSMKHSEKSDIYNLLKSWLRDGLLLSKGVKWQTRRKILTPTFHFNILKQFSVILQENTLHLLQTLDMAEERPIDVVPVISEFTLNSICETAMGTQLSEQEIGASRIYKDAIYKIGSVISFRFCRVYLRSDLIFNLTSLGKVQKQIVEIIHSFTRKVIEQRKIMLQNAATTKEVDAPEFDDIYMKKKKKVAMLDLLISAEKDGLIDSVGIQEEVDTFMFEGHDTTASGLTFCMLALANHRDIQDRVATEIRDLLGDSDRAITMEDVNNLPYLDRCIKESLRMYPPVHFISRKLTEDVILSNKYEVPAGVMCHISIYDLHHREDLYPEPSRFDPDRFLPEETARRHPYAYIPFSAGPRNCIGQKFAILEMKIVLAEVLRRFDLQPVTRPADLSFIGDLVLRNNRPVYVNFIKRT